ncbi:2-oxoacid:ferredoxin oxidoreductase subunit beta [Alicyclobacillus sp. SO9]|uniref:2-oxoacid:ferredoxin oxidoreductase subunit beta n=1 Tax=Alicyclobacillus sp. SO9 TaxID=2665646 RepID=UPI0018E86834|nr:2-oxoacid:ferredoxin oxidoreductase subunit beta [Alicyclobacillus sp. SO9]QQE80096.1 2-oxoacid:ferredoxin oxidoreductase subunit beta [Alicyclobacillus sp. SO9]
MATVKDFKGDVSTWCPGCGDFSVMAALQRAAVNMGLEPHQMSVISGIGCSSKISEYTRTYGFHGIHGRSLPVAQGAKMANPELTVIASGGDGDGYGIGVGHFIHAVRRNIDITYLVMDNQIYGLTKGQTSPRSQHDFVTKTTAKGNKEYPVDPISTALSNGGTFIAQGYSGDVKNLTEIIEKAISHKGFSLVNVFSPCVTFNKINTYNFFKDNLVHIDQAFSSRTEAINYVKEHNGLVTGIVYEEEQQDFQSQLGIDWNMHVSSGDMDADMIHEIEKTFM